MISQQEEAISLTATLIPFIVIKLLNSLIQIFNPNGSLDN